MTELASEKQYEQQAEQQAEQQQPVSSLYASSQVDQSSRNSLPESEEAVAGSQQQPDSPLSSTEALPGQMNGMEQGRHESQVHESEGHGSQQSSQDNQEQRAELPGTLTLYICLLLL